MATKQKKPAISKVQPTKPRRTELSPQEALIYVMVLTSAVDRDMNDTELQRIGNIVHNYPAFKGIDSNLLTLIAEDCAEVLNGPGGVAHILGLIEKALPAKLRETAYAFAVEVAAVDLKVAIEEMEFLDLLATCLHLDRLLVTAIERSARARHQTV